MENILENLNKEQLSTVKSTNGSILVLAGAGSGKTRVLTTRIAYLVQNSIKAYNILAVTFTNKAAKEMKERLASILGEDVVKKMWVGTFHSICGKILRQDIDKYKFRSGKKLDKNFTIYDEQDSLAVIKQAIKKLNLDEKIYQPKLVKSIISNAKNKMQDAYTFATYARDFRTQRISSIYDLYESYLNNNNAIDFDDMLMLCVKLLEQNKEVREKYYKRFSHILVDEFQDTNIAQYDLIKYLYTNGLNNVEKERSLCVVGDVDQSIYSWRGADFRIILNFQNDFKDCKLIKLEQNYRSTGIILQAANEVIKNNNERIDKVLYSNKGDGDKIVYYEAQDDADEANYIASTIKQTSANYNQFAILYRTNAQSRSLEEACISHGIPYKIFGGLKFYDRKEIKDIVAYLKLIYNSDDSQSLKRIINVPRRSIGDTTISKLQSFADENDISLFSAIERVEEIEDIQSRIKSKLDEFKKLIYYFKEIQSKYVLSEFISIVLDKCGYINELKSDNTPEDEARVENLQEFVNVASEFVPEEEDNILGEFLSQISLVSDLDEQVEIVNCVTLMTLHSAKGLEFPIVFLAGLEDGVFPHSKTFNSLSELEEERRLMYVGVTRAEEKLYLTSAKRRQMWGEYKYYNPSRFIAEIPYDLIDSIHSTGQSSGKTFVNAVKTLRSNDFENSYNKPLNTISAGAKKLGNPVRKNNYSEYVKNNNVVRTSRKSFVIKSDASKKRSEEKMRDFFENSAIKRKVEENRQFKQEQLQTALKKEQEKNTTVDYFFNVGERVFHDKLGVGYISDVVKLGESTMYTIDFGKMGKKAMDANYARLKKF